MTEQVVYVLLYSQSCFDFESLFCTADMNLVIYRSYRSVCIITVKLKCYVYIHLQFAKIINVFNSIICIKLQ